jgi:hypothetical protein
MINEDFKYINEAEKVADYMIEHLYDTSLYWLDTEDMSDLSPDEFNEIHAEFMKQVMLMMLQD